MADEVFTEFIAQRGQELYRGMPWREDTRPYYVLVSELMLQQTQVARVIPKFEAFIERFPSEVELAAAPLSDVLKLWQGLGYNRRAKYLHDAAKRLVWLGSFPNTYDQLQQLPGVGPNTAGAICAYSFNQPVVYVETNIRTVYLHHFFADCEQVDDHEIRERLGATLDQQNPRVFYWALMDYGAWLKSQGVRINAQSRHYSKQSPLAGSLRESRGQIVRLLAAAGMPESDMRAQIDPNRYDRAIKGLLRDGLIQRVDGRLELTRGQ